MSKYKNWSWRFEDFEYNHLPPSTREHKDAELKKHPNPNPFAYPFERKQDGCPHDKAYDHIQNEMHK